MIKNFVLFVASICIDYYILAISSNLKDAMDAWNQYTHSGLRDYSIKEISMTEDPLKYFEKLRCENHKSSEAIWLVKIKTHEERKRYEFHGIYAERSWALKLCSRQIDEKKDIKITRICIPEKFKTSFDYLNALVNEFKQIE